MAAEARDWRTLPLFRALLFYWETLLTARGRYLLVATIAFALVRADTRRTQAYFLFAAAAALLLPASLVRLRRRPRPLPRQPPRPDENIPWTIFPTGAAACTPKTWQ